MSERVARGRKAFNEYEEVRAAFDRVEAVLVQQMTDAPIGADVKVLRLHSAIHALAGVRAALVAVIDDGQMAERAVDIAGLSSPY